MEEIWNQERVQRYIDNEVEESHTLDYKAAAALGKSDGKKKETTKDVSSMANSAGGIVLYGVKECDDKNRRHLPEAIDPINRREFPKEWLEHVINSIQPRIKELAIHSVSIDTDPNHVVYVIEIAQSTTGHQARDLRYYRRFNFESVPMYDYEIRDVMNRAASPDAEVLFSYKKERISQSTHHYRLEIQVKNLGAQVINNFKLIFTFPNYGSYISFHQISSYNHPYFGLITNSQNEMGDHVLIFRSRDKLFPEDQVDIGELIHLSYQIDDKAYANIRSKERERTLSLSWTLYADDMQPKKGEIPFSSLHVY